MQSIKTRRKNLKILFFAAILLTATIAAISIQNQNTGPLINLYMQGVSQSPNTVIRPKMDISNNITLNGSVYSETINVLADNIVIDGNGSTVQGPANGTGCGFYLNGRSNVTIKNVTVTGWQYGFYLLGSSNNNFTGNTANINSYGVFLDYNSNNNTLWSNIANNNNHHGFCLYISSNNNTLSNNKATNNGDAGFDLYQNNYNTLSGNTANNNPTGFVLQGCSNNILSGNTANNNGYKGFVLASSSNNNLSGNIANNNVVGFELDYSSYNTFSGNTVNFNTVSFFLFYSSNNNITGNTIEDALGLNRFYVDPNSYNNTIENNTVIATGLPLLLYSSFYSYQQGAQTGSNVLIVVLLVALITAALIGSVFIYRRGKGGVAVKGKQGPKPDRWKSPS